MILPKNLSIAQRKSLIFRRSLCEKCEISCTKNSISATCYGAGSNGYAAKSAQQPGTAQSDVSSVAGNGKKARWDCRKGQIAAAREKLQCMPDGAGKQRLQNATDRFARDNVAVEKARISAAVYDYDDPTKPKPPTPPEGWIPITDPKKLAQYGLSPDDLHKTPSNFRCQLYEPDPAVFGDEMKPTIAFKGTEMTNLEDWKNNLAQSCNFHSDYYKRAVEIGKDIKKSGMQVHMAGHSLGGGTASAASQASGMPATTFNAAGLHSKTVARYDGIVHQTNIQAYRVNGDILTCIQENGLGTAAALAGSLAVGSKWGALEKQKTDDQQVLASITGKICS